MQLQDERKQHLIDYFEEYPQARTPKDAVGSLTGKL